MDQPNAPAQEIDLIGFCFIGRTAAPPRYHTDSAVLFIFATSGCGSPTFVDGLYYVACVDFSCVVTLDNNAHHVYVSSGLVIRHCLATSGIRIPYRRRVMC